MDILDRSLEEVDPEVADALADELHRQQSRLVMIASENFVPRAVLEAQGSVLVNKLAEGYPGKRYCAGCENVDIIERLAIERAKALFEAEHANVQPHSGAQANAAAYMALLDPGDTILGLDLAHGGHLTHGMQRNFSGHFYTTVSYQVRPEDCVIDVEELARLAEKHRPKLIVAGWSAYPRQIDFEVFRRIADEVGAYLLIDMAHFAGLVAAGLHPNPVPWADVVTSTTHKTLTGPRGGLILCRGELADRIDTAVFPGQQAAPLAHTIAAKAVAFKVAAGADFRDWQRRTVDGARVIADRLGAPDVSAAGVSVLTGGTDVHLVMLDLRNSPLDGRQAEQRLYEIGITVNRNVVPFDRRPALVGSGLRIGASALATRGFANEGFREVADIIAAALQPELDEAAARILRGRVDAVATKHPVYSSL
ncbi:serine hydroxymethyltransferase [Streptomyces sp. SID3343]|uniref:serine hydroxymethyltransferase n=1 Tax=Streptomyces sp. SID3343 TaxID=2690260 RepID=UPI00136CED8D|nr:serine hydroxymethyltransferase [Streptomyces sp. SID3343]MYW05638.1 aminotransferase class I/II-fold pyridoxal phosphate-dependent enzyme [Streptomyces sp. SID3343]